MFDSYSEVFADRAAGYHKAMKRFPRARDAEFIAVVEPLKGVPKGLVCDLPSGGGYLATYLPPYMQYVGIDPVNDFIKPAAEVAPRTIHAGLTDVPLSSGSVDYLVSLAGLHHEQQLSSVFNEMRRLIRRKGRLVVADVAAGSAPARFLNGFVDRYNPQGHHGRFLDASTAVILERVGLEIVSDEHVHVPWVFDDLDQAGVFAADLFGIAGVAAEVVVETLADQIGFQVAGMRPRLQWSLRRIVCEAR